MNGLLFYFKCLISILTHCLIQNIDFGVTLSNCLAFSTMARSFGSDNNELPFIFSVSNFLSVNCAIDDGSKFSKSFLSHVSNSKPHVICLVSCFKKIIKLEIVMPEYVSLVKNCWPSVFCQCL